MSDSLKPHDRFFKLIFSEPAKAAGLLKGILPLEVLSGIDLDTLQPDTTSYVDEHLKEHFADLVFDCQYREGQMKLKVVILFEHKSYPPVYPHLQLLRYMLNIWEQMILNKERPRPVIPCLVYHGAKGWKSRSMESYFSRSFPRSLMPFLPSFDYLMLNLREKPLEEIQVQFDNKLIRQTLVLLKYIQLPTLENYLEVIFSHDGFEEDREQANRFFRNFIHYLYQGSQMDPQLIKQTEESLVANWGYVPGSPAEQLINQGREEGREEGGRAKARAVIQHMFKQGQSEAMIAQLTGFDIEMVQKALSELDR